MTSSAVSATSRNAAIELLDEVGNAEVCELFTVKNFMVHFRLKEETDEIGDFVPVKLEGFDEETVDTLCDRVYPRSMMEWQRLCANGHLREFFPATSLTSFLVPLCIRLGITRAPQPRGAPFPSLLGERINSATPLLERPRRLRDHSSGS